MKAWRSLLRALRSELDRCSQEVGGQKVLPNWVDVALPNDRYEALAPILRPATAEIGEALVEWARSRRRRWYDDSGPHLHVRLESRPRLYIACTFTKIEERTEKIEEPAASG